MYKSLTNGDGETQNTEIEEKARVVEKSEDAAKVI